MANVLSLPHHPQKADGYCLPACVQMVLAHLGVFRSQEQVARQLGTRPGLGTPHSNVVRLESPDLRVVYGEGDLDMLRYHLERRAPVIVFVQAGEFPHWSGRTFRHAVVAVDLDDAFVYILDPASEADSIAVPQADFLLAWDEMDNTCAVITQRT